MSPAAVVTLGLGSALEVAAYYVVSESLTNVGKHAEASSVSIDVGRADGSLIIEIVDDGVGGADSERGSGLRGLADRVEALGGRLRIWTPRGGGTRVRADIPMRVAIAEDSVLLREGLARLLSDSGFDVVAQCEDADELLRKANSHELDAAIVDIRLPPTHNDEGLRAAIEIREQHPSIGVLVLSVRGTGPRDAAARRLRRGGGIPAQGPHQRRHGVRRGGGAGGRRR